jgi:uncharacterized protein YjdB
MKLSLQQIVAIVGIFLVLGCSSSQELETPVESISLSQPTAELLIGETTQLVATVLPSTATNKTIQWTSSKQSVATISSSGLVTAIAEGQSTIMASSGGKSATCIVTVSKRSVAVNSVSLNKSELVLDKGQSETLTATVTPDDAADKTVIWSSSDTKIVTVDSNGKVTAVAGGSATITAKAGDKQATCTVTVLVPVESIVIDKESISLEEGSSTTLVATVKPDDATDNTVIWTSSDEHIATVDDGTITAVAPGTATVTASAGGKSATCKITVEKKHIAVTSISLDETEITLTVGDNRTLVATVEPDDATDNTVTWSSSNKGVATVDGGKVTAISVGTATITASVGDQSATCSVIVYQKGSYVDEYGVNQGQGITIDGITWAPVNCGFKEASGESNGFIYGKLYQWGRKDGQGYGKPYFDSSDSFADESTPTIATSPWTGKNEDADANTFYSGVSEPYNWITTSRSYWNDGTESAPVKNELYDPCPSGWRVPTISEMNSIAYGYHSDLVNVGGIIGIWFTGNTPYSNTVSNKVFIPATGGRFADYWFHGSGACGRGTGGDYWSSSSRDGYGCGISLLSDSPSNSRYMAFGSSIRCCKDEVVSIVPITSLSISLSSISIPVGDVKKLTVVIQPQNATYKAVFWTSSNESVAKVASDGTVSALSEGQTTITASVADKSVSCKVTVEKGSIPVSSIALDKSTITLTEGESWTLSATVKPDNATDKSVTWSSSNTSVAKVEGGKVTAVAQGTATITAKAGDKSATCKVTVEKNSVPVSSITLNKTSLTLAEGESQTLTATVNPDNATDKTITWTSSNKNVATVADGKVTAIAKGSATITASAGGKSASCSVSVQQKEEDTAGPSIVSFDVSPKSVDVTDNSQKVTFTVHLTDETGVKPGFSVTLFNPDDVGGTMQYVDFSQKSGDKKDGYYEAVANIGKGASAGTWKASISGLEDELGHQSFADGLTFQVINNGNNDTVGPNIVSFDVSPKSVDVTDNSQKVTFTVHLTDETGVKPGFSATLFNPVNVIDTMQYADFSLKSGDKKDGYYEAIATIAKGATAGSWTVSISGLKDELGHQSFANQLTLEVICN